MRTRAKASLLVGGSVVALLAAYVLVFVPLGSTSGPPIAAYPTPRTALLVMDLQRDFLADDGRMPVARDQVTGMLDATNALLARATELGLDVVYVRNAFSEWDVIGNLARNGAAVAGSDGARLDPRVRAVGNAGFTKDQPDAFSNPELDAHLREHEIGRLVVAGVFADQCVRATVLGALNREYQVTVLSDGVAAATDRDREQALVGLVADGAEVASSYDVIARLEAR
jgi:nicotinamidase-related amidase